MKWRTRIAQRPDGVHASNARTEQNVLILGLSTTSLVSRSICISWKQSHVSQCWISL